MCIVSKPLIPRPGSLLEAIERLVKPADMMWMSQVDEAGRLLAVDLLVKRAMEEGILDVELTYRPSTRSSDAEDDANGGRLDDGTECLVEVDTGLLREATDHPTRFVPRKSSIRSKFMLEDPFS
jgi:hypothetical protein